MLCNVFIYKSVRRKDNGIELVHYYNTILLLVEWILRQRNNSIAVRHVLLTRLLLYYIPYSFRSFVRVAFHRRPPFLCVCLCFFRYGIVIAITAYQKIHWHETQYDLREIHSVTRALVHHQIRTSGSHGWPSG